MLHVEFTVEPFVDGKPGPHVTAAIDAVRARSLEVEFGPFSSSFDVPAADVGVAVGDLLAAAYAHGATHVQIHVQIHVEVRQ